VKLKLKVGNRVLDSVNGPLKDRLEHYYRSHFPRLVKKLEAEGKLRSFLEDLRERWHRVFEDQFQRSGDRNRAEELANDVVFERPTEEEQERKLEEEPEEE
jgi:hypothetical protein